MVFSPNIPFQEQETSWYSSDNELWLGIIIYNNNEKTFGCIVYKLINGIYEYWDCELEFYSASKAYLEMSKFFI